MKKNNYWTWLSQKYRDLSVSRILYQLFASAFGFAK